MKRSSEEYARWVQAVNLCSEKGWQCVDGWRFRDPNGGFHDLSAANLNMLDEIMESGVFAIHA